MALRVRMFDPKRLIHSPMIRDELWWPVKKVEIQQETINWLLDSDPAIRWQVRKDILHETPALYEEERRQLALRGWCARLLHFQDEDGLWNRSLYNGKWISTTYSLYLLKILGLPPGNPQALRGCEQLLTKGLYRQEEIRFSAKQDVSDLGVTAIVLSLCSYFGHGGAALPKIASFLARLQSDEGNWFPNESASVVDYTFETTLLVLEALHQYRRCHAQEKDTAVSSAMQKGLDFLLEHNLGLGDQTPIKSQWISFSFPPYWFYDILTVLDTLSAMQTVRDIRCQRAVDLVRQKQTRDGKWLLGSRHAGKTYFEMEKPGSPSRWNTLRALRVLDWWEGKKVG